MIYATAVTSWFVTPAFADLRAGVDGGSSTLAWWLDEGAEGDFTEDQMLTALETILRTNDATMKARAAEKSTRYLSTTTLPCRPPMTICPLNMLEQGVGYERQWAGRILTILPNRAC